MTQALKGKRALVTGGSRGIGAAIVQRLAAEGADVALTYVSQPERAEAVAAEAAGRGVRTLVLAADSADAGAVSGAIEQAVSAFGGLDILICNAGIAPFGPLDEYSLEDFDRVFAVNVRAVFVGAQAAARVMGEGGRIIAIGSSMAERLPFPGAGVYGASKSALHGLVKGLARDLGPRGITINNVQPGPIDTDANPDQGDFAEMLKQTTLAVPRFGTADEVAALVAFVASPQAAYITGASLTIDGGFCA